MTLKVTDNQLAAQLSQGQLGFLYVFWIYSVVL